jgi:translation initiation factor IF-3
LGDMPLKEAKIKASSLWLDLMEIWKIWNLVIVKMLDYWKLLYKQKKKEQKNKQRWKVPDLKSMRLTFQIWDHDLDVKKRQAMKFAELWHSLKLSLMLKWRENNYSNLAMEKIKSFVSSLEEFYKLDWTIKKAWNTFSAMLKVKK